jgi:hypothetical protein
MTEAIPTLARAWLSFMAERSQFLTKRPQRPKPQPDDRLGRGNHQDETAKADRVDLTKRALSNGQRHVASKNLGQIFRILGFAPQYQRKGGDKHIF